MENNFSNPYGYFPPNNYNQQNSYSKQYASQMKQYAFVNGIEGAKSFQLPANQSMLLMDADHSICYMKSSDAIGKCSLRYFKLEEIDESTARSIMQPVVQQPNYALKEDVDNLSKKMDEILKKLNKKETNNG